MRLSLPTADLAFYIRHLLLHNFPLPKPLPDIPISAHSHALDRLEFCFSHIRRKYYYDDLGPIFDPLNGDHLCSYLWFLANTLGEGDYDSLAVALSQLNKRLHGLDLFYSVRMPDIFLLVHPVGSVFGSAKYGNYFVGYQNCTVGADASAYPEFGTGVICYSGTSIIGACSVGSNVVFAANSFILNMDVAENSLVTGSYPHNRIRSNSVTTVKRIFTPDS
jgi:serine O-acetyltransferase